MTLAWLISFRQLGWQQAATGSRADHRQHTCVPDDAATRSLLVISSTIIGSCKLMILSCDIMRESNRFHSKSSSSAAVLPQGDSSRIYSTASWHIRILYRGQSEVTMQQDYAIWRSAATCSRDSTSQAAWLYQPWAAFALTGCHSQNWLSKTYLANH